MKTVKNMWAISKPATVLTLLTALFVLALLGVLWWMPSQFGYPWYAILGNLLITGLAVAGSWMIADLVNGR